jgi:intein-encoded DNA endonuclease-like protein
MRGAPIGNTNRLGKYLKPVPTNGGDDLTPELAYVLGVLKGDGYFCGDKRSIALKATDKEFVAEFKRCLEKQFGYTVPMYYRAYSHAWIAQLCSKAIYEFLLNFDIEQITNADPTIKVAFLRGFADSEGSVAKQNISLYNTERQTLEFARKLLGSLGIESNIKLHYRGKSIKENWSDCYRLTINYRQPMLLFYEKVGFTIIRKMIALETRLFVKERTAT